jgi:hypothetical protein
MADVSKPITERNAITRAIVAVIRVQSGAIAAALEPRLFPKGVPNSLTLEAVIVAFADHLEQTMADLSSANQAHAAEMADDAAPRANRDAARDAIRALMISVRNALASAYGQVPLSAYGLAGETPSDAEHLLEAAKTSRDLLRDKPIGAQPLAAFTSFKAAVAANKLDEAIAALETALGKVRQDERELQGTAQKRDTAVAMWASRSSRTG